MSKNKLLLMLQNMIGDDTDPAILDVYLDLAGQAVLNHMYPFTTSYEGLEVPDRYIAIQLKIAAYLVNKRGAEGEVQHIENGIHRNYGSSDIPEGMLKDITPFCQVIR